MAAKLISKQLMARNNNIYVGNMTIPIMNQVNTCKIMTTAKILAIPTDVQI
jgi:hypothetical protein